MTEGQFNTLFQHMKGRACRANLARSRSQSQSPTMSRQPSVTSSSARDWSVSEPTSPTAFRGASAPPPSPFLRGNFSSLSASEMPFSPRPAPSPLPSASLPLPFSSFAYESRPSSFRGSVNGISETRLPPGSPAQPMPTLQCPGINVDWPLALDLKFNETFPFHRVPLGNSLGTVPFVIEIR
ncbi:hypothetical protein R3P38DRAFT_3222471 [Favolaschia claudopus]|uniref:Uncharacterized protein n=1 Tax=Favolaschia claudopus TaxID=2862362 RepID=A0AAV9ZYN2_9AGAR